MESTAPKLRLDGPRARERTCVFNGGQFANEIEVAGFNKGVFQDFLVRIVITRKFGPWGPCLFQKFFQNAAETVFAENKEKDEEDEDGFNMVDVYKPSPQLITVVDGLKLIMGRIFSENLLNRNDYHVVLSESSSKAYQEVCNQ